MSAPPSREELLAMRHNPPVMGTRGAQAREACFGKKGRLRGSAQLETNAKAYLERGETCARHTSWPSPESLETGDALALCLEVDEAGAAAYVDYLLALAKRDIELSLAPYTEAAAGTFRLWALAAARVCLPASHRVEARHDLIGIRLAQVGLGFGADTLAGPVDEDRHLPMAGMTRPNENTRAGLSSLMELAGLEPHWT